MRNIAQYPVDDQDRLAVLLRLEREESEKATTGMAAGDMTLLVLADMIATLREKTNG